LFYHGSAKSLPTFYCYGAQQGSKTDSSTCHWGDCDSRLGTQTIAFMI
jgi:hypothetical protein